MTAPAADVHAAVEAVWRIESARIVGALARLTGDLARAEDLAQDALVAALDSWARTGVPPNPGGWLMTTARRRAIDAFRRDDTLRDKQNLLARELTDVSDIADEVDTVEDDVLRLVFTTCHPLLAPEAQVALTLRLVGGLTTHEIARAFLVPSATVGQRISRAKNALVGVPIEVPGASELETRLAAVLSVVYLVFNEGYAASAGARVLRRELTDEAIRLGRVLAGLLPRAAEVHGLVALMELQASRAAARVAADGSPVLLLEQDRSRWDRWLIRRGLASLAAARAAGEPGPYALQAEIAACHARAAVAEDTDWAGIAAAYSRLAVVAPSPVVELNRAMAVAMAEGPVAGLAIVDSLTAAGSLAGYHLLPAARGDLLARLGRDAEAAAELERSAGLTANEAEQAQLRARAAELRNR